MQPTTFDLSKMTTEELMTEIRERIDEAIRRFDATHPQLSLEQLVRSDDPQAMRTEIERRLLRGVRDSDAMVSAIARDWADEENRILYGDPSAHDGPKVRVDASKWIVK